MYFEATEFYNDSSCILKQQNSTVISTCLVYFEATEFYNDIGCTLKQQNSKVIYHVLWSYKVLM